MPSVTTTRATKFQLCQQLIHCAHKEIQFLTGMVHDQYVKSVVTYTNNNISIKHLSNCNF